MWQAVAVRRITCRKGWINKLINDRLFLFVPRTYNIYYFCISFVTEQDGNFYLQTLAGEKASELRLQLTSANIQQAVLHGLHLDLHLDDNVLYSEDARQRVEGTSGSGTGSDQTEQAVFGEAEPPQGEGK